MSGLSPEAKKALLEMKGDVRNDTPDPVERTVGKLLLDGVELNYGEVKIFVEGRVLRETKDATAHMPRDERRKVAARAAAALAKNYKRVLRNKFTKKVADDFYADLVLWNVLKETQA